MERHIGTVRKFSCQPYDAGTMTITAVEEINSFETMDGRTMREYRVEGEVIEGTTTSRLFGAVSHTPIQPGRKMMLYRIADWKLDRVDDALVYVYPV